MVDERCSVQFPLPLFELWPSKPERGRPEGPRPRLGDHVREKIDGEQNRMLDTVLVIKVDYDVQGAGGFLDGKHTVPQYRNPSLRP